MTYGFKSLILLHFFPRSSIVLILCVSPDSSLYILTRYCAHDMLPILPREMSIDYAHTYCLLMRCVATEELLRLLVLWI